METVQAQQMRSVPTEVVCVWMIVYINGCICNIHLPVGKYSMCAQCVLKWSSRYLTVYVGAQNGCLCACVYVFLLINVILTSPALAVAGKELVKQQLKRHVLGHDVVFAQVVAAGRAGVHLRSERPLETSLGRERARWGRFTQTQGHVCFCFFWNVVIENTSSQNAPCKHCVSKRWWWVGKPAPGSKHTWRSVPSCAGNSLYVCKQKHMKNIRHSCRKNSQILLEICLWCCHFNCHEITSRSTKQKLWQVRLRIRKSRAN